MYFHCGKFLNFKLKVPRRSLGPESGPQATQYVISARVWSPSLQAGLLVVLVLKLHPPSLSHGRGSDFENVHTCSAGSPRRASGVSAQSRSLQAFSKLAFASQAYHKRLCLAISAQRPPNLAIHINFLFLETHSLIFISASSASTLFKFQCPRAAGVPDLSLESLQWLFDSPASWVYAISFCGFSCLLTRVNF